MATEGASSEIIEKQRTKLLKVLQQDPDSILDTLTSRRLISEEEYETLEEITDPLKRSRKLLILIQKKGEDSCCCFLKCLSNAFPESASTLGLKHEVPGQGTEETVGVSRDSEDPFSLGTTTAENAEIAELSKEKERLNLGAPEFFTYKENSHREPALSPWEKDEGHGTPQVTALHSVERAEYEVPASITFLSHGQRYEEPDDSLYLEEGEHQQYLGFPEDVETVLEEGADDDPQGFIYDNEEECENEEFMAFSSEESSCLETDFSLEEEEKKAEERKRVFQHVLSCLNMDRSKKLLPDFVKQFSTDRGHEWTPKTPGDLAWNFLMKVQALDLTARDFILRHKMVDEENKEELLAGIEKLGIGDTQTISPLDVLCACMLCADSSLQREVMSNMYQCQFALPLLLPDAENNKSILMMGAMKDLKRHMTQSSGGAPRETDTFLSLMKMPVISFVRLGHCSFSKSRILNTLLSSSPQKPHRFFLHQDLCVPVLPRQISDGLVEVMWCFPDKEPKEPKECPHVFQKPVAVANLRGDLESFWMQFGFLVEVSSAVFFFTDCLGEKEWDLLMFLGEDAIERCYFVLSPQAKESEEAQLFQRILKLKPSQLLFWEVEEAGDGRKTMEALHSALQEVMSSPLRCVSLEDMASLARELGIQVDQDFEVTQDTQASPRTIEGEDQQPRGQTKSPSESLAQKPITEPRTQCEDNQNAPIFHQTPVFMPYPAYPWPLPSKSGSNFYHVPSRDPWVISSHFRSQQMAKWFLPFPHPPSRGQNFGIKYFQPWKFYSRGKYPKCSATPQQYHSKRPFGRSQRQTSHVQTHPESRQTLRNLQRSGTEVSHVGHGRSSGSQAQKAIGKPQPEKACAQGMQLTKAAGKSIRTLSHIKYPHSQPCQPAGAIQDWIIPISHQGAQQITQGRPSDLAFKPGSQSTAGSKLSSTPKSSSHHPKFQSKSLQPKLFPPVLSQKKLSHSQPSQAKPPHLNLSHANSTHMQPSHAKPTHSQASQTKPSHPNPSHANPTHVQPSHVKLTHPQPSHAKPTHPQPSHAKSTHPQPSHAKPTHPHPSHAKSTHPQPSHANSTHAQPSHAKSTHPQPSHAKPTHPQPSHAKPTHPQPFHAKSTHPQPSHANSTHPQPSHAKPTHPHPSHAKSTHPQPSHAKPTHPQPSHAKPTHPQPSHAKPTHPQPSHDKPTHPQPSHAKPTHPQPSHAKPTHPQFSQAKPSPSQSTQLKAHKPHQSQSKPFQSRPTQPKLSQTKPSQAKAFHPRAGRR
ncbi:caspase recruitment domain-containing protein 6 [Mastomys coucha]|uniref:caspase recruitment domain-containing protein 6 n=1 Tax=Mastomys coucha TaxID=35658 RepID=UPI001261A7E0|nr:caspase recruitment domain-containing protein 6 [Mastomys coucha]XP_031216052.1 caspase recruitment domain-containing protein 6 [Mastomys coucha]XP_031216053.1 caspase recruitment domain-containing protein 6 [Mastomys coucha]XP_031216054.1 caspase recruitment domain-containing protein 6 [Mastomys coucha]XP_031216055.1 caspase recruitment domain-containing protein 6 [Mastomys coucha]XP_031216056.1 caspase recruitment domain-containing protein 6 [Mastomys coucha]XP_031216057.1 caspase recrui